MTHAYAVTNQLTGLAASAFTWSAASTVNRDRLNDGQMDKVFSCVANASGISLVVDLGSAKALAGWAVLNHNLASAVAPTLKIEGADNAGISVGAVTPKLATTLNLTSPRHRDHVLQFTPVSKQYWRLTFTWTGSFTLTLGELFAYLAPTQLSRRIVYPKHAERNIYKTSRFESDTGSIRSSLLAGPIRQKVIAFSDVTESERTELNTMFEAALGNVSPLLWIQSYETGSAVAANDEQDVIWGKFLAEQWGWSEPDLNRFEPEEYTLRSLGRQVGR